MLGFELREIRDFSRKVGVEGRSLLRDAVLMLLEGLGSLGLWKSFPAWVAPRTKRRVIVYSRYGHGESDALEAPRDFDYMHHEGELFCRA